MGTKRVEQTLPHGIIKATWAEGHFVHDVLFGDGVAHGNDLVVALPKDYVVPPIDLEGIVGDIEGRHHRLVASDVAKRLHRGP